MPAAGQNLLLDRVDMLLDQWEIAPITSVTSSKVRLAFGTASTPDRRVFASAAWNTLTRHTTRGRASVLRALAPQPQTPAAVRARTTTWSSLPCAITFPNDYHIRGGCQQPPFFSSLLFNSASSAPPAFESPHLCSESRKAPIWRDRRPECQARPLLP